MAISTEYIYNRVSDLIQKQQSGYMSSAFFTGDQIRIVTAKTTAGGKCSIDLLFEFED
jgi:hypothetical protein